MANKYEWLIESMDCIPSLDGNSNVVSNVNFKIIAISNKGVITKIDEKNSIFSPFIASVKASQMLNTINTNDFIVYDDLTKEIVIDWVKESMGAENITLAQSALDNQINELINPSVISLPLPWDK